MKSEFTLKIKNTNKGELKCPVILFPSILVPIRYNTSHAALPKENEENHYKALNETNRMVKERKGRGLKHTNVDFWQSTLLSRSESLPLKVRHATIGLVDQSFPSV